MTPPDAHGCNCVNKYTVAARQLVASSQQLPASSSSPHFPQFEHAAFQPEAQREDDLFFVQLAGDDAHRGIRTADGPLESDVDLAQPWFIKGDGRLQQPCELLKIVGAGR